MDLRLLRGGGFNYHEIRNLVVTTPGGVRVDKTVDQTSAAVGSHLKYTVNVYNATTASISNLKVADTLKDQNGQIIPTSKINIDSVVFNNNGNVGNTLVSKNLNGNNFNAVLAMAASVGSSNSVATLTTYATILGYPGGGQVINNVKLDSKSTGITDVDTTNDVASASTEIVSTDLSIAATHNGIVYRGDQNKTLILTVTNNGPDATGTTTTVVDTLRAGLIYDSTASNYGWTSTVDNSGPVPIVTSVYNGSISSGSDFPPLILYVDVANNAPLTASNVALVINSTDNNLANNLAVDPIPIQAGSSLSVSLSAFSVSAENNNINLAWTTATEQNNSGFDIEHSKDGTSWVSLSFVSTKAPNGTSSSENNYTFKDYSPNNGKNYYRLKQINVNGNYSYSVIKSVDFNGGISGMLYPNPATTILYLKSGNNIKSVQIVNVTGQVVYRSAFVNQNTINVSSLTPGVYFARIVMKDNTVISQKLMIKK